MNLRAILPLALLSISLSYVQAGEIKSGVQVGGRVGTYSTTKCAGAEDGVKVGASLCYT